MALDVTGASPADPSPAGTVARFLLAGDARDVEACLAELHPDSLAQISGDLSPPPMQSAHVGEPEGDNEVQRVPVQFAAEDGTEQRFVFVLRPAPTLSGFGIDLSATMEATFGGDPAEMMMSALQDAFQPIGEALDGVASAFNAAFPGSEPSRPARRIDLHESLAELGSLTLDPVPLEIVRLDFTRSLLRTFQMDDARVETSLALRCQYELPEGIVAQVCEGIQIDRVESLAGEDLRPEYASDSLGRESYASWEQERREWYLSFSLRPPAGPFEGIGALEGTLRLQITGGEWLEVSLGSVAALAEGPVTIAALDLPVHGHRAEDGSIVLQVPYGAFDLVEIAFVDGNGQEISSGYSGQGDGETSQRTYDAFIPDDATVVARFPSQGGTLTVPFTAVGLPVRWE